MITGPILTASAAHLSALEAIHAAAFPDSGRWDAQALRRLLEQPGTHALLHPAGGMILFRVVVDESEILTLAVAPETRRQGVASALLREAEARARAAGSTRMFLEVSTVNTAAQSLYARAGYRRVGLRRAYYPNGADAAVLARALIYAESIKD